MRHHPPTKQNKTGKIKWYKVESTAINVKELHCAHSYFSVEKNQKTIIVKINKSF
jgi:hypothetical protein